MKLITLVGLLVFCAHTQLPSVAAKTRTVCENQSMTLSCGRSSKIHIMHASYGRQDGAHTCPHPSIRSRSYGCRASSSKRVLIHACEGKSRCRVKANNGVFGDPCRGLFKYLRVQYLCIQSSVHCRHAIQRTENIETVCEHHKMNIDCGDSLKIKIKSAMYGRRDNRDTCPDPSVKSSEYNCRAASSDRVINQACEGKSRCLVDANNRVFGDPCYGVLKYLRVQYQCIKAPLKSMTACEHQRMNIRCGGSKKIIIERASYGRSNRNTCGHVSKWRKQCHAVSSHPVVSRTCQGKSQCHLVASNSVFGDPCWGISKYLQVKYRCL